MEIGCDAYDRYWALRLDARGGPGPALDAATAGHAESCAACRDVAARNLILERAIAAWASRNPVARPGLADRVLASYRPAARMTWTSGKARAVVAALAAGVIAAGLALLDSRSPAGRRPAGVPPDPVADPGRTARRDDAVGIAAAATAAIARDSSAPVARFGKGVLATAGRLGRVGLPSRRELPAAGVWQGVRDRVGAAPLSGTARHALGFLLAPAGGDEPRPVPGTPPRKGA